MRLVGVADMNTNAIGFCYAKKKGIYSTQDYRDLYSLNDLNLIIELTGQQQVANEISRSKPDHVRVMDHVSARLFWDVFRIQEESIAHREQAEEAVRRSEQKYSTLVESSLTGIYIDQGGKIVFANHRFAEIYGYAGDELMGMNSWKLVHPEDRPLTNDLRGKRLKGESAPSEYEARGLTKDGKSLWIARRNSRIEYKGRPAILGNIVDITERKRSEEELRESQERYYTVLEACPDPVVVCDMTGVSTYVNPAYTQVFGWTPGEVLGMKPRFLPDENCSENKMMIDKVLAGVDFSGVESRLYTKAGNVIDVSISAATFVNRHGVPAGSVHILRDITDRKLVEDALQKAHNGLERRVEKRTAELGRTTNQLEKELAERMRTEEALRESEEELRHINVELDRGLSEVFEALQDIASGNPDVRIPERSGLELIEKLKHMVNITAGDLGEIVRLSHEFAMGLAEHFDVLQRVSEGDMMARVCGSSQIELLGYLKNVTNDMIASVTRELTERKDAEEALRLAHKDLAEKATALEAANEELSQYAYVVSHDLKGPLRAIRNYSDFLHEDLKGTLAAEQKAYLDGLNRAVQNGEELIGDLLEFSRVGRRGGPIEAIDMDAFFREFITSLNLSREVEVVMADGWPSIQADRTLLRQIFQNLVRNAVKFNRSAHKRVEMGWGPAGDDQCELYVRDNGIGIDPRYHEQIFRVFQRLHVRKEYDGTGLGLAIVKKAASKLRGSIRLESKPGEGSTFFVCVPKAQKER
jgi:PAS domain S-box-containing protein